MGGGGSSAERSFDMFDRRGSVDAAKAFFAAAARRGPLTQCQGGGHRATTPAKSPRPWAGARG